MGVVRSDSTLDHADHHRLSDDETSGGEHTIALSVRDCAQLVADGMHGTASRLLVAAKMLQRLHNLVRHPVEIDRGAGPDAVESAYRDVLERRTPPRRVTSSRCGVRNDADLFPRPCAEGRLHLQAGSRLIHSLEDPCGPFRAHRRFEARVGRLLPLERGLQGGPGRRPPTGLEHLARRAAQSFGSPDAASSYGRLMAANRVGSQPAES